MKHLQSATLLVTAVGLVVITGGCAQEGENLSALNPVTGPTAIVQNSGGTQGCSPGYWKKHSWAGTGFSQNQTLESVFDVPDSLGLDDVTLLEALNTGGGGVDALLRHAVAALLNVAHPSVAYPIDVPQVLIDTINMVLASGDAAEIEIHKDQLDVWNNFHTPGFCD
jgi:hypothetical protein